MDHECCSSTTYIIAKPSNRVFSSAYNHDSGIQVSFCLQAAVWWHIEIYFLEKEGVEMWNLVCRHCTVGKLDSSPLSILAEVLNETSTLQRCFFQRSKEEKILAMSIADFWSEWTGKLSSYGDVAMSWSWTYSRSETEVGSVHASDHGGYIQGENPCGMPNPCLLRAHNARDPFEFPCEVPINSANVSKCSLTGNFSSANCRPRGQACSLVFCSQGGHQWGRHCDVIIFSTFCIPLISLVTILLQYNSRMREAELHTT